MIEGGRDDVDDCARRDEEDQLRAGDWCPDCDGKGYVYDSAGPRWKKCPRCTGGGREPTGPLHCPLEEDARQEWEDKACPLCEGHNQFGIVWGPTELREGKQAKWVVCPACGEGAWRARGRVRCPWGCTGTVRVEFVAPPRLCGAHCLACDFRWTWKGEDR